MAFWDDDAAIDAFLAGDSPLTEALAGGWSAHLEPRRAVPEARGHFPGLPTDLPLGADDGATDAPVARVSSTFSLWESSSAAAFATSATGHIRAMAEDGKETFHRAGSFVRFRPYAVTGRLTGRNPYPPPSPPASLSRRARPTGVSRADASPAPAR